MSELRRHKVALLAAFIVWLLVANYIYVRGFSLIESGLVALLPALVTFALAASRGVSSRRPPH